MPKTTLLFGVSLVVLGLGAYLVTGRESVTALIPAFFGLPVVGLGVAALMREAWRKLGHPSPSYKNDRAGKAFELFIPELDKEVDMASDLMKAMFGEKSPTQSATQLPTQSGDPVPRLLAALLRGEMASGKLREALGIKHRPTFRKNYLHPAIEAGFIEYTIPDKPNSRLQAYRLTDKGRQVLTKTSAEVHP